MLLSCRRGLKVNLPPVGLHCEIRWNELFVGPENDCNGWLQVVCMYFAIDGFGLRYWLWAPTYAIGSGSRQA